MYIKEKRKLSFYLISLYVFIMFCVYPLYYENGYYNMATAKCRFFLGLSIIAFLVILMTMVLEQVMQKKRVCIAVDWKRISITEKLLYTYILMLLLSFAFSEFKEKVLWGQPIGIWGQFRLW